MDLGGYSSIMLGWENYCGLSFPIVLSLVVHEVKFKRIFKALKAKVITHNL
jgi:hypothetical protein